ncbi:glutamate formimidoyltransferase + methenyltetrahydrofolate cyclohydrolase [Candidatus Sulfotelmatomonas gaucii]|uniref:Formimidoyltransferase-cyclodeaminase n=1 Tax=Candidatus Sulfuritelmatomonas gaucii TaxID=2043161 RepID=A0A2N9M684_9BACT|nr:glutamate formimidoyltransferase + methenyltetrahydrofolate cyclohydrolase [Candidatus Sulfotelmatomonas gaucii]
MPNTLIECVPNFSEGRDSAKVDAIVEAMKLPGVYVLDREMDADHNRSVITLAGEREAIQEAAIRGVGKAAELIDLNQHQGAHPRLGAADVVPFIPIEGVTLEDCVAMARHVGAEIWKRYQVPVYLYEAAAATPERQNLENIRRGQFEGIRDEIATNPARKPDFGEARLHATAGATVVGARKFLIAYNIYLNSPDVSIAKSIAKTVRFSSGGMPFVKASGFLVRGLAQVSMNLTDFEQTPLHRVFEAVKREAERYGVLPISSEIIGLIPKRAIEQAAEWFLQIENFNSALILENRLAAVVGGKAAAGGLRAGVEPFIDQLAAPTAVPGGGSAAAASGAMAAGLAGMVAGMSHGKKAYAQYESQLSEALARLGVLREELKSAIDADAEAYSAMVKAYKAAKGSADGPHLIASALEQAAAVPLGVAERAAEVARIAAGLTAITNPNMKSDLTTAIALAKAAMSGAIANVEINLEAMKPDSAKGEAFVVQARSRVAALKGEVADL